MKNIFEFFMNRSRARKYKQFLRFCSPTRNDKVLDVGVQDKDYMGNDNTLERNYPHRRMITALGIEKLGNFRKRYLGVKAVTYNGKIFPFKKDSFDFVWSNAVIEHVGPEKRQELFISEMLRVCKRKIVFTTPNRWFPMETHTKLPLFHWLPKGACDTIYKVLGKKWATGSYMYLLGKNDLKRMLDKVSKKHKFSYRIVSNRLLCMPATFTVLISKD